MSSASRWVAPTREAEGGRRGAGANQSEASDQPPESDREALYRYVKTQIAGAVERPEDVQYELERWMDLLETTAADLHESAPSAAVLCRLERAAGAAIPSLFNPKPALLFARTLRYRTEMELLRHRGWFRRNLANLSDGDPAVFVGAGVSLTMTAGVILYLMLRLLALPWLPSMQALVPEDAAMMTVAKAAFLGGGVSILARLREFSCAKVRNFEPLFLFWNALFNPIIAIIFGVFVYSVLASDLLPLNAQISASLKSDDALWVIGFLSGFSERFTSDIISRGESVFGTAKAT